ncbi:hypothetical protein ACOME3_007798 [Neoechinorhynchus agilis]
MAFRPPPPGIRAPRRRLPDQRTNGLWRNWTGPAAVIGCCLGFFGLLITVLEIARLFSGFENRGCVNGTSGWRIYQNSYLQNNFPTLPLPPGLFYGNFLPVSPHFVWPWTRPGILFGLLLLATGILGCISARRRSYSSIMAFYVCSLLSFFLLIFLIGYYSVAIHYYKRNTTCSFIEGNTKRSPFYRNSLGLAISILSFALFALLFSLCAIALAAAAMSLGRRKGSPNLRQQFRGPRGPVPVRPPGYARPFIR